MYRNALKLCGTKSGREIDKAKVAGITPFELSQGCVAFKEARLIFKCRKLYCGQLQKKSFIDKSGYFVCVIPGEHEVDLKLAAKASGNKKCDLIPMKELLPLTGYIRGGCSPIGMKKHFPTYIHETCRHFPYIYISAGVRGLQIKIAPEDLIHEAKAEICVLLTE